MNIVKIVGKMEWEEVTALQQLCNVRKQQLRAKEPYVYTVRMKPADKFVYLIYRNGETETWGEIVDPELAIYPTYEVADYVRQQNPGASVMKILKSDFKTLPCFPHYVKVAMVTSDGHFN